MSDTQDIVEHRPRYWAGSWVAGTVSGWLFVALGAWRRGHDFFAAAPTVGFGWWATARSIALFGLAGGLAGWLVAGLWVTVAPRRWRPWAPVVVVASGIALVVLAYTTVWWQLEVLEGLPLSHPSRRAAAGRHLVLAALIAVIMAWVGRWVQRRWPARRSRRTALGAGFVSLALLVASIPPLATRAPADEDWRPARIAVVGLDGLTFRVLSPMLRAGELPTFRRLVADGAWGSLLTYGVASSPIVWTSVATGKRARDHGVTDFVTRSDGVYQARTFKSFDWRARSVWSMLGETFGPVGVVNWLMTAPPQPVPGAIVTRLSLAAPGQRAYPPDLEQPVAAILERRGASGEGDERTEALAHIDSVFDVANLLLERVDPAFLAVYQSATDAAEHTTWKYHQPAAFDAVLWASDASEAAEQATLIEDTYRAVDRRLGQLLERLGDDTLLVVLSDHGQRAARRPRIRWRLDSLLVRLGVAHHEAEGRGLDYRRSVAYTLVETPWTPRLRVNINLDGREQDGVVPAARYRSRVRQLAAQIEALRFENGEPVFAGVRAATRPSRAGAAGNDADLIFDHTRQSRDPLGLDRRIRVGDAWVRMRELVEVDTTISGDHDRQGVVFLLGRGVRPGPIGQRSMTTALQELLHPLTDRVAVVDRLLPMLARLGLTERMTTLDVTPTLLHAAGQPVGHDMAGHPRAALIATGQPVTWVSTWERAVDGEQGPEDAPVDPEAEAEVLEKLRALGYVN